MPDVEKQIYIEPLWKMRRSYTEMVDCPPPGYRFVVAPSLLESATNTASRSTIAYRAHRALMKLTPIQLLKPALEIARHPPPGTALTWAILHINFRREPWVLDMSLEQPHLLVGSERMFDRWCGVILRALRSPDCRAIVCELEIGRQALLERLGAPDLADKVSVVRAAPPLRREVAPVRSTARRILFVNSGNIGAADHFYTHGGALLAPVFREIRRRHPEATLVVRSRIPAADRRELEGIGNVEIHEEMLTPDALDTQFREADVFLYPTHVTPSAVFLDAMSYGLPIVTTNVWGNGEFLVDGESGLLVHHPHQSAFTTGAVVHFDSRAYATAIRARDEALVLGLAEAVSRLLEDQTLRVRMGGAALERVTNGPFAPTRRLHALGHFVAGAVSPRSLAPEPGVTIATGGLEVRPRNEAALPTPRDCGVAVERTNTLTVTRRNEVTGRTPECPACGTEGQHAVIESGETYEMRLCPKCSLVFAWPMTSPGARWYETAANYGSSRLGDRALDALGNPQLMLRGAHRPFLRDLPGLGGRLLDVGCGSGVLLAVAKKRYQVTGFDLQERAIRTARSRYSLGDVHVATLDQFFDYWQASQQQHYDVVTLFDVLEHFEDPSSSVGVLSEMLRPGGWLVLTLPNRKRWPDFYKDDDRPPNHLTRWDRRSMMNFLFVNGFTVVKLQEFNEYGLVSLRVLSRILSHVLKPVGPPAAGEPGAGDARSGVIRKSMWDSVAGWMWYACVKTAVVLDAPIYAFLRLVGAPRQMLYCVARRVEGIDRVRT